MSVITAHPHQRLTLFYREMKLKWNKNISSRNKNINPRKRNGIEMKQDSRKETVFVSFHSIVTIDLVTDTLE